MIDIVVKGADKVGGLGKLAAGLGIRHQSFYSWKKVPAERVQRFAQLTGFEHRDIRPDLFVSEGAEVAP